MSRGTSCHADEPLRLRLEARQRAGWCDRDLAADTDIAVDRLGDPRRQVLDRAPRLDRAAQRIHAALAIQLDAELIDLREATDDALDRAREHVHATDGDHVVDPALDPARELHERPLAGACAAHRADAVPCPVADDRRAPAPEVRDDELTVTLLASP